MVIRVHCDSQYYMCLLHMSFLTRYLLHSERIGSSYSLVSEPEQLHSWKRIYIHNSPHPPLVSINRTLQSSKSRRINPLRPIMTPFRLIIQLPSIKAITISLCEDRATPILEQPRHRFHKFTRITTGPREAIRSPPFTGNVCLGELAIEASMERQAALVVEVIFVIALEVVVVALAVRLAV